MEPGDGGSRAGGGDSSEFYLSGMEGWGERKKKEKKKKKKERSKVGAGEGGDGRVEVVPRAHSQLRGGGGEKGMGGLRVWGPPAPGGRGHGFRPGYG